MEEIGDVRNHGRLYTEVQSMCRYLPLSLYVSVRYGIVLSMNGLELYEIRFV